MPRNLTGGSGHKGRANGEGNTAKKNRIFVENFISDMKTEGKCEGVFVGRVLSKMGEGRMQVFFLVGDRPVTIIAPIKGSLRGRGKSQAHIDTGSLVLLSDTGLSGALSHEIVAVVQPDVVPTLSKAMTLDARLLAKEVTDTKELEKKLEDQGGFVFDGEDDISEDDIDNI
jgi:hypothetical protein